MLLIEAEKLGANAILISTEEFERITSEEFNYRHWPSGSVMAWKVPDYGRIDPVPTTVFIQVLK